MIYFHAQNTNFGYNLEGLEMENVGIVMTIWNILRPFGIFYGRMTKFAFTWYTFPVLVCLDQKNLATLEPIVF
jgi:hypothetical protein